MQVVAPDGTVITVRGKNDTARGLHAEDVALSLLENHPKKKLFSGATLIVTGDQEVCERCQKTVPEFAEKHKFALAVGQTQTGPALTSTGELRDTGARAKTIALKTSDPAAVHKLEEAQRKAGVIKADEPVKLAHADPLVLYRRPGPPPEGTTTPPTSDTGNRPTGKGAAASALPPPAPKIGQGRLGKPDLGVGSSAGGPLGSGVDVARGSPGPKVGSRPTPKASAGEVARVIASSQHYVTRAQELTQRIQRYVGAWNKYKQTLEVLSAIDDAEKLLAHGTAMPEEQHAADQTLKESNDAQEQVEATTEDISLGAWAVSIDAAERNGDDKALFEMVQALIAVRHPLETSARDLKDVSDNLFGQADDLTNAMYRQLVEVLSPHGESEIGNVEAAVIHRSLELLRGTTLGAAQNFAAASVTLDSWVFWLNQLADAAERAGWSVARKRALLRYEIEQARRFQSFAPSAETKEGAELREFMDAVSRTNALTP